MNQMDKNHPVRVLLDSAAYRGQKPSKAQLDDLDAHDLPDGQSLSRYRDAINRAADQILAARTHGYAAARDVADDATASIARRMTPEQAALSGDANPESLDNIASRMFGN